MADKPSTSTHRHFVLEFIHFTSAVSLCNFTINFIKLHCCSKLVMAQENAVSLGRLVGTIKDQQDHSHKSSAQQNERHPEVRRAEPQTYEDRWSLDPNCHCHKKAWHGINLRKWYKMSSVKKAQHVIFMSFHHGWLTGIHMGHVMSPKTRLFSSR